MTVVIPQSNGAQTGTGRISRLGTKTSEALVHMDIIGGRDRSKSLRYMPWVRGSWLQRSAEDWYKQQVDPAHVEANFHTFWHCQG